MARLHPREADVAALMFVGRGHCYFPGCEVKICGFVGNRYFFDCVRAHIEAAEPNGPRWNPARSDEELRLPANLMWLCLKHHSAVDQDVSVYTVELLREWKASREGGDLALRSLITADEDLLRGIIDRAMTSLVERLDGLNLPGADVAELLVRASEKLPDRAVAELLAKAAERMPDEDVAMMLYNAGRALPGEDETVSLRDVAERFPDEGVAMILLEASQSFPDKSFLAELDERIRALNGLAARVERAIDATTCVATQTDRGRERSHSDSQVLANPWGWFAAGVITVTVALVGGLVAWLVVSR